MSLGPNNLNQVLGDLNKALSERDEKRTLVVCGGGALLVVDAISRKTRDMDVVTPEIDPLLKQLATEIGKRHGLEPGWLNNGPASLMKDLQPGWRERTTTVYKGESLILESLGRDDFLASKLFAFCDRDEQDLDDILGMKPSWSEIAVWEAWLLDRDGSEYWPERVQSRLALLKKRIGHE